jgi:hypothetical protein
MVFGGAGRLFFFFEMENFIYLLHYGCLSISNEAVRVNELVEERRGC